MNRKHIAFTVALMAAACGIAAAQQITRVAVVDLSRVYLTYSRDSVAVRKLEEDKQKVQSEIDQMSSEIKQLQVKRAEASSRSDQTEVLRLDQEIYKKAQYLSEYYKAKQAELADRSSKLMESSDFAQLVYKTIQALAESDGYSVILSSHDSGSVTSSIIWYSPAVDITDEVIQALIGKAQ
jgi:outer membrane protein